MVTSGSEIMGPFVLGSVLSRVTTYVRHVSIFIYSSDSLEMYIFQI